MAEPNQGNVNPGNQRGGYKATLKNPNVSEEAKDHARDVLESNDFEGAPERASEGANHGNVMGGYKATLKNPRVSEEAKDHAEQVLKDNDAL